MCLRNASGGNTHGELPRIVHVHMSKSEIMDRKDKGPFGKKTKQRSWRADDKTCEADKPKRKEGKDSKNHSQVQTLRIHHKIYMIPRPKIQTRNGEGNLNRNRHLLGSVRIC